MRYKTFNTSYKVQLALREKRWLLSHKLFNCGPQLAMSTDIWGRHLCKQLSPTSCWFHMILLLDALTKNTKIIIILQLENHLIVIVSRARSKRLRKGRYFGRLARGWNAAKTIYGLFLNWLYCTDTTVYVCMHADPKMAVWNALRLVPRTISTTRGPWCIHRVDTE